MLSSGFPLSRGRAGIKLPELYHLLKLAHILGATVLFGTHPPDLDRIELAEAWKRREAGG